MKILLDQETVEVSTGPTNLATFPYRSDFDGQPPVDLIISMISKTNEMICSVLEMLASKASLPVHCILPSIQQKLKWRSLLLDAIAMTKSKVSLPLLSATAIILCLRKLVSLQDFRNVAFKKEIALDLQDRVWQCHLPPVKTTDPVKFATFPQWMLKGRSIVL